MFGLGPWELAIILVLGVLLFGSRLPGLARSVGRSVVEFKQGLRGVEQEVRRAGELPPPGAGGGNGGAQADAAPPAPQGPGVEDGPRG